MWLYLPRSASSNCAPAADTTAKPSAWLLEGLASSVTWRGKPLPQRSWSRVWRTVPWTTRLFGLTSEPSTAAHGVASWISSLAASRVSPTASPGSSSEPTTSATSGRSASGSFASAGLDSPSSRTWAEAFGSTTDVSDLTLKALVTASRKSSARRRTLVRRMAASASSSSQWLTPDVPNGGRGMRPGTSLTGMAPDGSKRQVGLENQVRATWPTPDASLMNDGESRESFEARRQREMAKGQNGNGMGTPLAQAAQNWPTARASERGAYQRDHGDKDGTARPTLMGAAQNWPTPDTQNDRDGAIRLAESHGKHAMSLHHVVDQQSNLWATPRAEMDSGRHRGTADTLHSQSTNWTTPQAGDASRGQDTTQAQRGAGSPNLASQAKAQGWPTPKSRDWKGGQGATERQSPDLDKVAERSALSHPATPTTTTETSSTSEPSPSGETSSPFDQTSRRLSLLLLMRDWSRLNSVALSALLSQVETGEPVVLPPAAWLKRLLELCASRRLSPLFVEWLMGWSEGWTSLAPIGSASSATASCPSRQRSPFGSSPRNSE